MYLIFFIPTLYASTKHCYYLDRLNCDNCSAPLMFKCGSEIKFANSTAPVKTVQVEFITSTTGLAGADKIVNHGNSRGAHRFDNEVGSIYRLHSPPNKAGDLVENLNNRTGHLTNTEEWVFQKITERTNDSTVTTGKISQAQMSYHIDDNNLNINPEEEGLLSWLAFWKAQDKKEFCWYTSVPQILGAHNCQEKFCLADIKCRKNDTIATYKQATCKAIGANYDRCPQSMNCIGNKGLKTENPKGYFEEISTLRGIDVVKADDFTPEYGKTGSLLLTNETSPNGRRYDNYFYTLPPQLVTFETYSCGNFKFCIADIRSNQPVSQVQTACSAKYDDRCPVSGQRCVEKQTKKLSMRNATNVTDLMGISLLTEVADSDRDTKIRKGTGTKDSVRRRQRRRSNESSDSVR